MGQFLAFGLLLALLLHQLLKVSVTLLESGPDGDVLSNGAQLGSLQLIEEVVVLVEQLLLLVSVAGNGELYFADQALVDLGVDHDVPRSEVQTILDPHNIEVILVDPACLEQEFNNPDDLLLVGVALAPQEVEHLKRHQIQALQILPGLRLEVFQIIPQIVHVDCPRYFEQVVDELIELRTDITRNCALEVAAVHAHADLFLTEVHLGGVRSKGFAGEQQFHLVALLADLFEFVEQNLPVLQDLLVYAVFQQRGDVHQDAPVILVLTVTVLYLGLWIREVLQQLLHPFGYDTQNGT
jgi:hypothetical protein